MSLYTAAIAAIIACRDATQIELDRRAVAAGDAALAAARAALLATLEDDDPLRPVVELMAAGLNMRTDEWSTTLALPAKVTDVFRAAVMVDCGCSEYGDKLPGLDARGGAFTALAAFGGYQAAAFSVNFSGLAAAAVAAYRQAMCAATSYRERTALEVLKPHESLAVQALARELDLAEAVVIEEL